MSKILNSMYLDPYFVTGFSDAESSFIINLLRRDNLKFGWQIQLRFQFGLHSKDLNFLKKYPIFGLKALDFNDFCTLTNLINKKTHLTLKGLEDIKNIKKGMNRNRVLFTLLPTQSYLNILQTIKFDMFLISFFHYWLRYALIALIIFNP